MREILRKSISVESENPKVTVIMTRAGVSFSCKGKHLYRMSREDVVSQIESSWLDRSCDSLYFTYNDETYFISDKQLEVICEEQVKITEGCITGEVNTFDSEQIALISKNTPMVSGIKSKFLGGVVRGMSNMFAFRARFTRAI